MKVVVILPTYNEKGNIERLITILEEDIFPTIKNHQMHIVVADDKSPDGTGKIVEELIKKYKNLHIIYGEKQGLGAAYVRAMTTAIEKLDAEVMFEMDADFFHDPKKIPYFLKKIDEGYDFIVGTRYSDGGSIPKNWRIHRKAFSIIGNLLVRMILMKFYIHDWTGGYRAIKKEVFLKEKEELGMFKGYTFQVAFLNKAVRDGFKITEVPFNAKDRELGRSKIAPLQYIVNLLQYVITARFFEVLKSPFPKYAAVGFTGYLVNAISLEVFKGIFHIPSGFSASLGGEMSIIWNFIFNNFWVFSGQRITSFKKLLSKFFQFNMVSFGSLVLIGIVMSITTYLFGDTAIVRQLTLFFSIPLLIIPYSYTMYNIFIWKRWRIPFLAKLQNLVG